MSNILVLRDVQLLLCSVGLALVIAWFAAPRASSVKPVWPIRLYLFIIHMSGFPGTANYSRSRRIFSRREQFLTIFFVWFFILFGASIVAFSCGRSGC